LQFPQHHFPNNRSPDRPLQMRELADVQLASPFSINHAGIGTDDCHTQVVFRQMLGQSQCVCTASSNGETSGEQQNGWLNFGHVWGGLVGVGAVIVAATWVG